MRSCLYMYVCVAQWNSDSVERRHPALLHQCNLLFSVVRRGKNIPTGFFFYFSFNLIWLILMYSTTKTNYSSCHHCFSAFFTRSTFVIWRHRVAPRSTTCLTSASTKCATSRHGCRSALTCGWENFFIPLNLQFSEATLVRAPRRRTQWFSSS